MSVSQITEGREKVIIRTSVISIITNILLAGFKAAIGLLSNSIAVILDAVNNLSDALSSVITIVGTKLAKKKPDKKHPLGYGRIEYMSALVIAGLVLYAGITALVESVKKIITPEIPEYSNVSLLIILMAVIVKLVLGTYVIKKGQEVNSGSLVASGSDARFDAVMSAGVFLCALLARFTSLSLEAYVGVIIAGMIIKAGIEMMGDTLDDILGKRTDPELAKEIKQTIRKDPAVHGAYDLILHSYGPERLIGSVHVEVPDTMNAEEIDTMTRRITEDVYREHGILLTGLSIYSMNTRDEESKEIRQRISQIATSHDVVLQIHGFYVSQEKKTIHFDVIIDYAREDRELIFADIVKEVQEAYPEYQIFPVMDIDI